MSLIMVVLAGFTAKLQVFDYGVRPVAYAFQLFLLLLL